MSAEQQRYQVKFDWGIPGALATSEGTDVVVWVDQLDYLRPTELVNILPEHVKVIGAQYETAGAAARWVMEYQLQQQRRLSISVIAAGRHVDDTLRFSAEDQLAAGAVIDHLGALGLDATSPEAATAAAVYAGLSNAATHIFSAVAGATAENAPLIGVDLLRV